MSPVHTLTLTFDRPTKRTVRFYNEDFGTVYVPNAVYDALGRPQTITMSLEAATELVEPTPLAAAA